MLLYQPIFRDQHKMARPVNLAEAEALPPGATPLYAEAAAQAVDVETPAGEVLAIDDSRLIDELRSGIRESLELTLLRSDRAMTDCRPVSLFSLQTVEQLSRELGFDVDKRRFRANIYIELESGKGFDENEFVNRTLRIGNKTTLTVVDRDPRCKMITLDPETTQASPDVMRVVARSHDGKAGIYAAVVVEGTIRRGDKITVVN
jgi:uncharacterized protein YcbX